MVVVSGLSTTRKIGRGSGEESILKKSSAFLSNFAQLPGGKIRDRKLNDSKRNNCCGEAKYPCLKGYLSLLDNGLDPFQRAPTVQTLLVERRRTSGVKKSVSFSSDTSFEEKRAPYKRAAVHEVKVYHKGVLQGMHAPLPSLSIRFTRSVTYRFRIQFLDFSAGRSLRSRCFLWKFIKRNIAYGARYQPV